MRLLAALFALLAATLPAAAAGVPDISKSTYTVVRARFAPAEALPNPDGPDPYIGVKAKGDVRIVRVLSGKLKDKHFTAELWLPAMSGPLDVYLLLEQGWEGAPQIAAWSLARNGFCIEPDAAVDGPVKDLTRLRRQHPCLRKPA